MAVQYAGGTNVDSVIAADDKTTLIDNLKAELVTAGWSVASGSSGDWKLDSATTPQGFAMRVRLYIGTGSSALIYIMNQSETLAPTNPIWMYVAAGQTYNVLANKYQCFLIDPGGTSYGRFGAFGVPCVNSSLTGLGDCVAWACGNRDSDTGTSAFGSFRTILYSQGQCAVIWGSNQLSDNSLDNLGPPRLMNQVSPKGDASGYQWYDGSKMVFDAQIGWGMALYTMAVWFGWLWDAFVLSDNVAIGTDYTYDSKTFRNITVNTGTGCGRGTLFVYAP